MRKIIVALLAAAVFAGVSVCSVAAEEELSESYCTMADQETGRVICRTSLRMRTGDQYLTSDNRLFQVVGVTGTKAEARFIRREELNLDAAVGEGWLARLWRTAAGLFARNGGNGNGPVAIYHTHNDESYILTEGKSSKPNGGVEEVGRKLADEFEQEGVPAVHDDTSHLPHDGMAYERSRRTAVELLRRNPAALFDIHRDAAPQDEYADEINNQGATKVQIVLGRSNPNLKANEAFAKKLKAVVDRDYPGLIKGIYYGDGKFNQDLSPRALLLEFGAQTNARESAERTAAIFADAAKEVVAGESGARTGTGGAWRSVLYVLGGLLAAVLIYAVINTGSLGGAWRSITGFFRREFANALGDDKDGSRREKKSGDDE